MPQRLGPQISVLPLALAASFWAQEALTQTRILFAKFVRLFIDLAPMQGLPRASLGWPGRSSRAVLLARHRPACPHTGPHLRTHTRSHSPRAPGTGTRATPAAHADPWRRPPGADHRRQPGGAPLAPPRPPGVNASLRPRPTPPQAANKRRRPNQPQQPIGPPVCSVPRTWGGGGGE